MLGFSGFTPVMTGFVNPAITGFSTFSFNLVGTGFINPLLTRCQSDILNPVRMGFVNPVVTECAVLVKKHFFDFAVTGFINPVMTKFSIFAKDFELNPSVLNLTFLFLKLRDMHFFEI